MTSATVTLRHVYQARKRIAPVIQRTPIVRSPVLSELAANPVHLKLENLQQTGAFKLRGAANKLLSLDPGARERGVITVSSGNHGKAVAYVAHQLGIRAVVCISGAVPAGKREAIRRLGAETRVEGATYEDAQELAFQLQKEQGLTFVHPFDDPAIIAGQGTIGLELLEDLPEIDTVVVPLSGGGLLGGIALALKSADPGIHVVGVSMERGPAMVESLRAGKVVDIVEEPTLADALAGIIRPCVHTFGLVRQHVDETVLVSEEEIAAAMIFALEEHHLVVEGGGAVGIAALMQGKVQHLGQQVAVVISGGNVDLPVLLDFVGTGASG